MHDDDGQDAVILQRTGLIITTQGCGKMIRTTVRMSMRKSLASVAQRQTEQAHQYTQRQYYTCSTVQGLRLSLSLSSLANALYLLAAGLVCVMVHVNLLNDN